MELKNQVVSLELAKKLKELGVEQEIVDGSFYFAGEKILRLFCWSGEGEDKPYGDYVKAHNVAELGEMLQTFHNDLDGSIRNWELGTVKFGDAHWVAWINHPKTRKIEQIEVDTEADARAKILIYLIENNLIQPNKLVGIK